MGPVGVIYGSWVALLTTLYLVTPQMGLLWFALTVLTNTVCIIAGVRRHRPRRRLPWVLLAASNLAFAAATMTTAFLKDVLHQTAFPSIADGIFLGVSFPLLLLSLLGLARSRAVIRDSAMMIDSLILTAGAGFLSWTFLIGPYLEDPTLTVAQKAISVAYPLGDVLVLSILVRLAMGTRRSWSVVLLLVCGAGLLTADVLYGLSQLNGGWQIGGPMDLGWAVFYVAGGAAALHRSMVDLTEPRLVRRPTEMAVRRVALGVASLVAPAVLLIQSLYGPVEDGMIIAVASAVLGLLAIARMSLVASGLRRTMTRERELRRACEALLSATDSVQVRHVVHAAVTALLTAGAAHRSVLVSRDGGSDPAAIEPPPGSGGISMLYTATLPAEVAAQLGDFDLSLHCPLTVGGHQLGDLYVAADEVALVSLQESAPVLAGQAASILDHIALSGEINRRDSEAYFRTLVLNATDVILIVDTDHRITYASPSAQSVLRTSALPGTDVLNLIDPDRRKEAAALTRTAPTDGRPVDLGDWPVWRADGEPADMEISIRDLCHEPTVAGFVFTLRDVTDRRRLERELLHRAYVDPLTGLGNRLQFQDTVQRAVGNSDGAGATAGVLLVNVDDFRLINDTMGHLLGDGLLIAVAERLVDALDSADLARLGGVTRLGAVARLGADEFGVVVESASDTAVIEDLADRIMALFTDPFLVAGSVLTVQPSIGVATSAVDTFDGQRLVTQADIALDQAKSDGKGRWRRYEESLHAQVLRRMQLRTELGPAIADQAFTLHYQPIVDLSTGRTKGFEALARWQHPVRGMIPPLEFIHVAEDSGLIVPLGEWVLRTAVAAAAGWHRAFPLDPPYVSVNVSVRQFRAPGFVDLVVAELADARLFPSLLTLEITESLLLGDQEQVHVDIARLRAVGVRVSIDDFGTGFSSLSYLHRVPVDTVKLDKSFVDTISTSPKQLDLVRGIIQLASTLHLDVVAEGIETEEDRVRLVAAGCGNGQGYLFARPMPHDEVEDWLKSSTLTTTSTA